MHLMATQEKRVSAALLMRRAPAALQQSCRQAVGKGCSLYSGVVRAEPESSLLRSQLGLFLALASLIYSVRKEERSLFTPSTSSVMLCEFTQNFEGLCRHYTWCKQSEMQPELQKTCSVNSDKTHQGKTHFKLISGIKFLNVGVSLSSNLGSVQILMHVACFI